MTRNKEVTINQKGVTECCFHVLTFPTERILKVNNHSLNSWKSLSFKITSSVIRTLTLTTVCPKMSLVPGIVLPAHFWCPGPSAALQSFVSVAQPFPLVTCWAHLDAEVAQALWTGEVSHSPSPSLCFLTPFLIFLSLLKNKIRATFQ